MLNKLQHIYSRKRKGYVMKKALVISVVAASIVVLIAIAVSLHGKGQIEKVNDHYRMEKYQLALNQVDRLSPRLQRKPRTSWQN